MRGLIFPAALLLGIALWLTRGTQPQVTDPDAAQAEPPRYQLRDADWVQLDARGEPLFRAAAVSIAYRDDRSVQLENVALDRLGGDSGVWQVRAPHGTLPAAQTRMRLHAPVIIEGQPDSAEPLRITAESLWLDLRARELYTEDTVQLTGPGREAVAVGLRADWAGEKLQLLNNVRVSYAPQPR